MKRFLALALLVFSISCNDAEKYPTIDTSIDPRSGIPAATALNFAIISEFPHDTSAYTQGLELYNGKMYEATGDYTNSSLRITDHKTGKVEQKHMMGTAGIFGEGITIFKGKIYQLTWESNIVYVYDVNNINKPIKSFSWPYDGWGITNNGTDLILSDGSTNLYFVDPDSFKLKSTVSVQSKNGPVDSINELEYVDGFVYANIYMTNTIVKIDPSNGYVVGILNFPDTFRQQELAKNPRTDYFNGIAYDSSSKSFFLTGKRWSKMFEVKIN